MIEGSRTSEGRRVKGQQFACMQSPFFSGLCAELSVLSTEFDLVSVKRGAEWVAQPNSLARAAAARALVGRSRTTLSRTATHLV